MRQRKLHSKIGISNKNLNYYEINDDLIKNISDSYHYFEAIKININIDHQKLLIPLFKKIILLISKYQMDISQYLFYIDGYQESDIYYLNELVSMIEAYSIHSLEDRYSYLYDYICNELDYRFNTNSICDFKNDLCCSKRCLTNQFKREILIYGCCYTKGRVCPYLKDKHCSIKSVSCKFFTCRYLKKKGYHYRPNDFAIINYFFNTKQKRILRDSLFTDKEEMIFLLLQQKSHH